MSAKSQVGIRWLGIGLLAAALLIVAAPARATTRLQPPAPLAAPQVQTIFQLSSPNWGDQLADLAYSWWGGWLAGILGQRDDAVYSLQTGQMSAFRAATDGLGGNSLVHFRTAAGSSHGPLFGD